VIGKLPTVDNVYKMIKKSGDLKRIESFITAGWFETKVG
jgi:hypothetical protein